MSFLRFYPPFFFFKVASLTGPELSGVVPVSDYLALDYKQVPPCLELTVLN